MHEPASLQRRICDEIERAQRNAVGMAGWNPALGEKEQTIENLILQNHIKVIYLDSDSEVACISGAPSDVPEAWWPAATRAA